MASIGNITKGLSGVVVTLDENNKQTLANNSAFKKIDQKKTLQGNLANVKNSAHTIKQQTINSAKQALANAKRAIANTSSLNGQTTRYIRNAQGKLEKLQKEGISIPENNIDNAIKKNNETLQEVKEAQEEVQKLTQQANATKDEEQQKKLLKKAEKKAEEAQQKADEANAQAKAIDKAIANIDVRIFMPPYHLTINGNAYPLMSGSSTGFYKLGTSSSLWGVITVSNIEESIDKWRYHVSLAKNEAAYKSMQNATGYLAGFKIMEYDKNGPGGLAIVQVAYGCVNYSWRNGAGDGTGGSSSDKGCFAINWDNKTTFNNECLIGANLVATNSVTIGNQGWVFLGVKVDLSSGGTDVSYEVTLYFEDDLRPSTLTEFYVPIYSIYNGEISCDYRKTGIFNFMDLFGIAAK